MSNGKKVNNPELFFGLVAPIGVDLDIIQKALEKHLKLVGYDSKFIHITDLMKKLPSDIELKNDSFYSYYNSLIDYADDIRKQAQTNNVLSALAIEKIAQIRCTEKPPISIAEKQEPITGTAYIIRQFKREEEINLLRDIYGRKFIQISVYSDEEERKETIKRKIKEYTTNTLTDSEIEIQAIQLIEKDYHEENHEFGQRISDVFHLGDVFVSGQNEKNADSTIERFINAFFGDNSISPNRKEYGMYAATSASLRSIDLSRQVGAAIFSMNGEVITLGCNEVPKAFGGTYWCDDASPTHRDFDKKIDANHQRKTEIIHDFLKRLSDEGHLKADDLSEAGIASLTKKLQKSDNIKNSQIMDIIEFGRMIHAEMCAITDASRLGKSLNGSILFCTTFPCHMCAKHIVSSGIKRVVFLEPYPKSYAKKLHSDSISFSEKDVDTHVIFEPFIGISPRRYRDIFEKKKRKDSNGKAKQWYKDTAMPRLEDTSSGYLDSERSVAALLMKFKKSEVEENP